MPPGTYVHPCEVRRRPLKGQVHEVDVDEHEGILERVAAIDVAKASAKVCTRVPHASLARRRVSNVWDVGATTNAITALADELAETNIERVVVESTSDYWRPFFYLLEARGLTVWLVNAETSSRCSGVPSQHGTAGSSSSTITTWSSCLEEPHTALRGADHAQIATSRPRPSADDASQATVRARLSMWRSIPARTPWWPGCFVEGRRHRRSNECLTTRRRSAGS
jgi:hypothetical protein